MAADFFWTQVDFLFLSLSFFFFFLREFIAKSRPSAGYIKKKSEFPFSSKYCKVFPHGDRHLELSSAASVGWALPAFFVTPASFFHAVPLPL